MNNNGYIPSLVALSNYGSLLFSAVDQIALQFVLNRTLKYNKLSEAIPYRHWLEGIYDSTGKLITAPAGITKKTVTAACLRLQKKGFISVSEKRIGNVLVNLFTIHIDKIIQELMKMAKLNISKRWNGEEQKEGMGNEKVGENDPKGGGKKHPAYK